MNPHLVRCETCLRGVAARGRETLHLPGYQAFVAAPTASPFLSLAVPLDAEAGSDAAIDTLVAVFAAKRVPLRFEYMAELHPGLDAALAVRGFHLARRDPVMTCTADDIVVPALPYGVRYEDVAASPVVVGEFMLVQAVAFTMTASGNGWESIFTQGLREGVFTAALAREGSTPIGAATLLRAADVAELAGVGTLPDYRRKGVAAAVCGRLVAAALGHGHALAWLSADPSGAGVYARLGFQVVGTQLNFEGGPSPASA